MSMKVQVWATKTWDVIFTGDKESVEVPFKCRSIVLRRLFADKDPIPMLSAELPEPIFIPNTFVIDDEPQKLPKLQPVAKSPNWKDIVRRFSIQEITWDTEDGGANFCKLPNGIAATGSVRGDARLDLSALPGNFGAEFSLRATYSAKFAGAQTKAAVALVCVLDGDLPRLRLDFDDLNFSFPAMDFPELDLSSELKFPFVARPGSSRLFDKLASASGGVEVSIEKTSTGNDPHLQWKPAAGSGLNWSLVEDVGGTLSPAVFKVKITTKGAPAKAICTIENFSAGIETANGSLVLTGTISAQSTSVFDLPNGSHKLGALVVSWNGVKVTPTAATSAGDPPFAIFASIEFDRLMVHAADDPSAAIAVKGELNVTPSGTRVVSLELVEPYPLVLPTKAAHGLHRCAAAVLEIIAELVPGNGADLRPILDVLSRMAVAIGRSIYLVGEFVGEALHAVAEAIGRLLRQLSDLASTDASSLVFEVRIASDRLELLQILITRRQTAAAPATMSALGLKLEIAAAWEPGLLLDFVSAPGAYLIASRSSAGVDPAELASISTDLWLKAVDAGGTQPLRSVRDADSASGDRGDPLITATLSTKGDGDFVVLLAGLRGGRGVFFQKLKTVARKDVVSGGAAKILSADVGFAYETLGSHNTDLKVDFRKDRVLPFLGMGEPGTEGVGNDFLERLKSGLGQTVWVKETQKPTLTKEIASVPLKVGVKAAGLETDIELTFTLSLSSLECTLDADKLVLKSNRLEQSALGLTWVVESNDKEVAQGAQFDAFVLKFANGESSLSLSDSARMQIRFAGISSDGRGVALDVKSFSVGRAGLDLKAEPTGESVVLNGIQVPFHFTTGRFEICAGKLVEATIGGKGSLPQGLVGEVDCDVLFNFGQDARSNEIVLQKGLVEFGKRGERIACESTRFTLTIDDLDIAFERDNGYHFYFLVSGGIQFTPLDGEFDRGLLQYFKDVKIDLEQVPLTSDARILANHVSFQKALKPKKSFNLFNLFEFEIRSFGFHPSSSRFEDRPPAINVAGQIKFSEIGDVMQPSADFHGLWITGPMSGGSMPRIKADGLTVDVGLSGAARIRGSLLAVDPDTPALEGAAFAPTGYNASGFLGSGEVHIEGWATMAASLGFMEVARKDAPDEKRKSFFLYLQAEGIAVEIPVVLWTFYMREVGFGLGYRYSLAAIKEAEKATSTAQLVRCLDDASKKTGELSNFASWMPDPEGDNITLAMRALFQSYPANKTFRPENEAEAEEPFLFDIVAALRSDMTFLMSARGWVGTNYSDYWLDKDGSKLRNNPGLRGYSFISAPRSEFLMRAIGNSNGYLGSRLSGSDAIKAALRSVDWSMTLFVNPKLFHLELGWPNELVARLSEDPRFLVTVRGGMIFRAADDGLLWAYNIEADALIQFSAGAGGDSFGVAVEATLQARFVARLLAFVSWRLSGSLVYGFVSLDANLEFRVRAWMEFDFLVTSCRLEISFSFSVQFTAAIEVAVSTKQVGARVRAHIAVSAFGCTVGVGINFEVNPGQIEDARARVQRFLALGISNEAMPGDKRYLESEKNDKLINDDAQGANRAQLLSAASRARISAAGSEVPTDFWLVLHKWRDQDAYAMLVPRAAQSDKKGSFYAPSLRYKPGQADGMTWSGKGAHRLTLAESPGSTIQRWNSLSGQWADLALNTGKPIELDANWDSVIPATSPKGETIKNVKLGHLFKKCFLEDGTEPPTRVHGTAEETQGGDKREREVNRERAQRDRATEERTLPEDYAVYNARSTVIAMFLDQFVGLAKAGSKTTSETDLADVTDIGLVFRGPVEHLLKLNSSKIDKAIAIDENGTPTKHSEKGDVRVFNPPQTWFENSNPVLERTKDPEIGQDGVKVDWRLQTNFPKAFVASAVEAGLDEQSDPEQFLHHYEVTCEIDGVNRWTMPRLMKPSGTEGKTERDANGPGKCTVLRCDWQLTDDLADLPVRKRRAMLPSNGEETALQAAAAWATEFRNSDHVTLNYTIVPVDVAGTRGSECSIVVDVPRPRAPVRPATAELRFQVNRDLDPSEKRVFKSIHGQSQHPLNLDVALALRDGRWDEPKPVVDLGAGFYAHRLYRLIVDPVEIVPSGNYGSDGLTERHSGLGPRSGNEVAFCILPHNFGNAVIDSDEAKTLEAEDELRLSALWLRFGERLLGAEDGKKFFATLWSRLDDAGEVGRVSCQFHLETLVLVNNSKTLTSCPGEEELKTAFVSARTPVQFEVKLETLVDEPTVVLRPERFEWPVRIDLPPLAADEVRATSGFAHFCAPGSDATLGAMISPNLKNVVVLRDPERRVLTTVQWNALPRWNGGPDPVHRSTIGGYDLYELDVDSLAPMDRTAGTSFAKDAKLWSRARRTARTQIIPRSEAMLTPYGNDDLLGWDAHYPSQTWRAERHVSSGAPSPAEDEKQSVNVSRPMRRGWYSAAESTIRFPDRPIRRRLLPTPDEAVITSLMRKGKPARVVVSCNGAHREFTTVAPMIIGWPKDGQELELATTPKFLRTYADGKTVFVLDSQDKKLGKLFTAETLRWLLLSLAMTETDQTGPVTLKLEGTSEDGGRLADAEVFLDFSAVRHAVLEELLSEIEYSASMSGRPYRRFKAIVQPVPALVARDTFSFFSNTSQGKDPYGWGALQTLGLATTLRLYDGDNDCFVGPEELLKRVNIVLQGVLSRYLSGKAVELGLPFVEILLRPGADRLSQQFDAVAENNVSLDPDDRALAVVQVSLRPKRTQVWRYAVVTFTPPADAGNYVLKLASTEKPGLRTIDVLNTRDGRQFTLEPGGSAPVGRGSEFKFVVRHKETDGCLSKILWLTAEGQDMQINGHIESINEPSNEPKGVSVFGAFERKSIAEWSAAMAGSQPAKDSFLSNMQAAFPNVTFEFGEREIAQYLDWSQRFLDHTAGPNGPQLPHINAALAGPTKATPWRLAASLDGVLSLSFLHSDRWGQTRAYAIRPFSRYQEIMIGAGCGPARASLDGLLRDGDALDMPIGYGIAVSPRTEKLEPPLILGSRIDSKTWQVAVAHHKEQNLASSNRSMLGRTGFEGVALSFVRKYRDPQWPSQLKDAFRNLPEALLYPEFKPQYQSAPAELEFSDTHIKELSERYPSLWKGADIYKFGALPHQYRVAALAVARAGVVVSPVVWATQTEWPVEPLTQFAEHAEERPTEIRVSKSGFTDLVVTFDLVSYRDLALADTKAAWPVADDRDVALWPDPDVVYVLERRFGGSTGVVDEDAEVRLVSVDASAHPKAAGKSIPIVVRTRGTRYVSSAETPSVEFKKGGSAEQSRFTLTMKLGLAARNDAGLPLASAAVTLNRLEAEAFNKAALRSHPVTLQAFAAVLRKYTLSICYADPGNSVDEHIEKVRRLNEDIKKALLLMSPQLLRTLLKGREQRLDELLKKWETTPPKDGNAVRSEAELPIIWTGYYLENGVDPFNDSHVDIEFKEANDAQAKLAIFDVPTQAEVEKLHTLPNALELVNLVKRLARELLSGGSEKLTLKVIHGRAGVASVELGWPEFLKE